MIGLVRMEHAQPKTPTAIAAESPATQENLLTVRDLCVSFHDGADWLQVLKDVSLDVRPGEIVGIVGESGCGKSLTALSILGLLPRRGCRRTGRDPVRGPRSWYNSAKSEMRRVRGRRIGMIFQEPMSALDPVFTVGDQIAETVRDALSWCRAHEAQRARRRGAGGGRHSIAAQLRQRCIR